MLNKKSIKIVSIVLLAVIVLGTLLGAVATPVFADTTQEIDNAMNANPFSNPDATKIAGTILSAMKWIGVVIAVGMLIYLGIKYVTSSPDGKADLKGKLGVYILGFVLIVAATSIVGILEGLAKNI